MTAVPQAGGGLSPRERYLRALASKPVDRPPAWLMRQAGRYLPEYRSLRSAHSFLDSVHQPELAAEITLQPMRRYPLDAAILFSDILVVLEALGLEVTFPSGGPQVVPAIEDGDPSRLSSMRAERDLAYVAAALAVVREQLGPDHALLGFAGGPYTLACYAIEGGGSKDFAKVRALLLAQPERMAAFLSKLTEAVTDTLVLQVRAGADAVQVFDTWAGTLSADEYRAHVAPHARVLVDRVHAAGGKVVLFVKDSAHLLPDVLASGADAIGVDWRTDIGAAARAAAGRCAVQGNLDPAALFAPADVIRTQVRAIHQRVGGATGHVFNLGHGVLPGTPVESVATFLDEISLLGSAT